jgi:hypothetical protein
MRLILGPANIFCSAIDFTGFYNICADFGKIRILQFLQIYNAISSKATQIYPKVFGILPVFLAGLCGAL